MEPKTEDFLKEARESIIFALDVGSFKEALALVDELHDHVGFFKVGLQLFISEGPDILKSLKERGRRILLDLKLHDIPNTVAGAVESAVRHGVSMMTLHVSGSMEMMMRARESAEKTSAELGIRRPLLLGVTLLTSIKEEQMKEIGFKATDPIHQVTRLANLAKDSGMDGIVCSAGEIDIIEKEFGTPENFLFVTPGIRPEWAPAQDQKRITTPTDAILDGADYLVIGRPIRKPPEEIGSPVEAAIRIAKEIADALEKKAEKEEAEEK